MKKFLYIFLIFFVILSEASAEKNLRVGYMPGTGFLEEDRQGHVRGYGYEYMEFLSRYGDWKFEYIPCTSWEESGEKLQNGTIDLLPAMPGDYRSLKNVTRTDHVIGRYCMQLVTKNGKIKPKMKIGTNPTNAPLPSLPKVSKQEGFEYELKNYENFFDMEEAFKRDEIDGYIGPMLEPNKSKNVAAIFDRQSYRLLVKSENKELLAAMNIAMDEMLLDQPNIRNRLNDKYLRPGGSPLILNKQEKDYLAEKKKLTTAILMPVKPYAYYENGKLHGVIPILLEQIAKDLDIEIEVLQIDKPSDVANLIKRGAIDFVADAVCDFSWAGTLNMAPTQSYMHLDYVAVMRRGDENEKNPIVACDENQLYTENFIYPNYPEERRVYCNNLQECFEAVSDGTADILFAPRGEIIFLMEETGSYNLEVAAESNFSDEISLGVSTVADIKLWRILNKEVNHLDLAKIRSSVNKDLSNSAHRLSFKWQLYHHPLRVIGVMILLAIMIGVGIFYRMTLRKKHLGIVQQMAYTDSRYQLPNLTWLENESKKLFEKLEEEENLYIATFKIENESYDKKILIKQIKFMAEELRKTEGILLTSTGEESNSLVSVCKDKNFANIARIAREIVRKCGAISAEDSRIGLNIKVGVSIAEKNKFHQSIEQSNIACKKSNKEVKIFDKNLQDSLEFEKRVENSMHAALANGEFQAWYQTEYEIKNHTAIGEEAFVRWQSPEFGFLMPEKFMPIFERNGFILAVDYFMVEEVCKQQKKRLDEGKNILPISINQSGLHLNEENYLEKMRKILQKYNLPKGVLKLEFSEQIFTQSTKDEQENKLTNIFRALQKLGFIISTDDFGENFSSYKLLNFLPVDEMKIDGTLLYAAVNSKKMQGILENIIQLGNKLNLKVICEGVETKTQENLLLKLGCKYGQGFIFS